MSELKLRVAVVTGAASGIGRALATRLVGRFERLHLVDIDAAALIEVVDSLGPGCVGHTVDVAQADQVEALASEVGTADLVCLNAGVVSTEVGPPWAATPQEWERVLGVNLYGVVNGLRAFVPALTERGRGHVLITCSLAGAATWPGGGPYAASKHAVLAIAEQAALHLAERGIGVTVTCPALVRSAMSAEGEDPLVVADRALAGIEAGRFALVPGEWHAAVRDRAETLTSGRSPSPPALDQVPEA